MFSTPILFLIFNRPDTTEKVFNEIRKQKPQYLFIAADGPRENNENDIEKCRECRDIVANIDWDCEVKTLFREQNLGCGVAPAQAITWFFENVEQGIILEDDIFPDQTFFPFCAQMLERFKNDERVMHISGCYFPGLLLQDQPGASYYFTRHVHAWGWASWRRAWKNYDYNIKDWKRLGTTRSLKSYYGPYYLFWRRVFSLMQNNTRNDIWDYQWMYSIYKCNGLVITSTINLVVNIGFNIDATHTVDKNAIFTRARLSSLHSLIHSKDNAIDWKRDEIFYKYFLEYDLEDVLKKKKLAWQIKNFPVRAIRKLRRIFG